MRLSIKEKAGIVDTSRIYEGLHLSKGFIKNMADEEKRKELDGEIIEEGEIHFGICDKCRKEKDAYLPFKKE